MKNLYKIVKTETHEIVRHLSKTLPIHEHEIPDTQLLLTLELIDLVEKRKIKFKTGDAEECFDTLLATCLMNFKLQRKEMLSNPLTKH
jgi:hypothetical protein